MQAAGSELQKVEVGEEQVLLTPWQQEHSRQQVLVAKQLLELAATQLRLLLLDYTAAVPTAPFTGDAIKSMLWWHGLADMAGGLHGDAA